MDYNISNERKIKNNKFIDNTRLFVIVLIIIFNLFIFPSSASSNDFDNDGLNNTYENWWATDPYNVDSDGDGVWDGDEVSRILSGDRSFGTPFFKNNVWNNLSIDGDRDGVPDLAEIYIIRISPDKQSTDGDKYDDGQELFGISPNGVLPGYVTSPGDNVFVAAYPEINIDISDSISIVNIQEITFETRNSTINTQGYSASNTEGTMLSVGTSTTHSKNSWIDVNNKEADVNTQNDYYETITNTEENYFKGYTEGKSTEIEVGSSISSTVGAKVGVGVSAFGPSAKAEVSSSITGEISGKIKNTVEKGMQDNNFGGTSNSKTTGGNEVNTRIRETSTTSGFGEESSFTTSISKTSYHETTVTNSNSIATGYEWGTATMTNTGHAADLVFTYFIENTGTDIALEVDDIVFNIFIGDEDVPITYFASADMSGAINNLKPLNRIQFSSKPGSVPLTLQQLRKIDEGAPIRIVLADYSYGLDELSYENAWGRGVLFEIDDGVSDGDETIEKYMIPAWGEDKYANILARVIPINIVNESLFSINNQPITEWTWWDIYLQKSSLETKFLNETSYPKTRVFLKYNQDSDHDYYIDRTEILIGSDPADILSHPSPLLSAGAHYGIDSGNTTIKLKLSNSGNFDAHGIEARLFSPDNSTTVFKEIVGGGGRVSSGQTIFPQEEDMFVFTNNSVDYTEPIIIVNYNDPQGNYNFITPLKITDVAENVSQQSGQMIYGSRLSIDTASEYTFDYQNSLIVNYNNPTNYTIKDAHIYVAYQSMSGDLFNITNVTVNLYPGNNSIFNWWNPSDDLQNDIIGQKIKVVVLAADYQGILIDEDVKKIGVVDYRLETPEIVVLPNHWDLGTINQGQLISKNFTITNRGLVPLKINIISNENLSLSNLPFLSNYSTRQIDIPGGSLIEFNAKINTTHSGVFNEKVNIYTNDPLNPLWQIPIYGDIQSALYYNDSIVTFNDVNNIWWRKVHVIGNYTKGTNLFFNHSILTEPKDVYPVGVYNQTGSKVGVGKKINDTDYVLEKLSNGNWTIKFTLPENVNGEGYYWIQFGKEIEWSVSGGNQSVHVNINNIKDILSAELNTSGKYDKGAYSDNVYYYHSASADNQESFWGCTYSSSSCGSDSELDNGEYSPPKGFLWDPYNSKSLPTYADIRVNGGSWYRKNGDRTATYAVGPYATQIVENLEFQISDYMGSWHIVKSYQVARSGETTTQAEWSVNLPLTYFSPLKTNYIRIHNSDSWDDLRLYSDWITHSISVSYDYEYGTVNPAIYSNNVMVWNYSGNYSGYNLTSDFLNTLSNGTNELTLHSDKGATMFVYFEGMPIFDPITDNGNFTDISISHDDVSFSENNVIESHEVTINATVHNLGDKNISNFIVSFYDGDPTTNGTLIGNDIITETLSNSNTLIAQYLWDTTGKVGIHDIYVNVDPYDKIVESNKTNNIAYKTFGVKPKPDLLISNISFSSNKPTADEVIVISATIGNPGGNVSAFNVTFFDGDPLVGNIIGIKNIPSLEGNNNSNVSLPWDATTANHDIHVVADYENRIDESNELNNNKNTTIFVSIDEVYIDNGNSSSDTYYDPIRGFGYLDGIIYNSWGDLPHQSTRYDIDGEIHYQFDNLDPTKYYHLDLNFYEEDNQHRVEEIWIDGIYSGYNVNITDKPKWISITLLPANYNDQSIVVSIKRSGSGDAIVNEMKVQEVESHYIDCGNVSDEAYNPSSGLGYIDGMAFTGWGNQPYQTIRYTMDEDVAYRFDNLDPVKYYQFNIVFYEVDNQGRIEEIWIDGIKSDSSIDMSDGEKHIVNVEIPNSTYILDRTINFSIKRINGANTIVNEITLEENTIRLLNQNSAINLPPIIEIISPINGSVLANTTLIASTNEPATLKYDFVDVNYTQMNYTFSSTGLTTHTTLLSNLPAGFNTVYVGAADLSGNINTTTANVTWTVDASGPQLSQVLINDRVTDNINSNPNIKTTITSPFSTITAVEYFIDTIGTDGTGITIVPSGTTTQNIDLTLDIAALSDGDHTIYLHAANQMGWGGYQATAFTIDTTPPVINIVSPQNGTTVVTPVITITGAVSDASDVALVTVNGENATGTTNWGADVTLIDGENNITIVSTDDLGNTQSVVLTVYYNPSAVIISMGSAEVPSNSLVTIPVSIANAMNITGISFDLFYNFSVVSVDSIVANNSFTGSSVSSNVDNINGTTRVVLTNTNLISSQTQTPVIDVTFNVTGDFGSLTNLDLEYVVLSNSEFNPDTPASVVDGLITVGINGDLNNNGYVDIGDVAKVAFMVAGKVPEELSADFNDNGYVDIGDAAKIAFYLAGKVGEL